MEVKKKQMAMLIITLNFSGVTNVTYTNEFVAAKKQTERKKSIPKNVQLNDFFIAKESFSQ